MEVCAAKVERVSGSQPVVLPFVDPECQLARQDVNELLARVGVPFFTATARLDLYPLCLERARTRNEVFDQDQPPPAT